MPGMNDNPLVGDYTKGISKDGVAYFRNLEMRALYEHARLSPIARDMQMGLFRAQKETLNRSVAATGLGRFGVKTTSIDAARATKTDIKPIPNMVSLPSPKVAEKAMAKLAPKAIKVIGLASLRLLYEHKFGL